MASANEQPAAPRFGSSAEAILIGAIFVAAICGLVYELIAGALSSYLLGDSITQFSIVIGLFLTAMGIGSFLSKYLTRNLLGNLIAVETAVGLLGGVTALVGFAAFALTELYVPVLLTMVGIVGTLVGLEIPLMIRILRELQALRITLANVLSADYVGALVASLLFPFALLPYLGLVRAGLLMGLLNVAVAGLLLWRFRTHVTIHRRTLAATTIASAAVLLAGLCFAGGLVRFFENRLYQDEIIYAADTPYQRLVLTRWREDLRLYLDGHLQFSSVDEYRYHETLVHPAMTLAARRANVLILGGGDGLAAREVLKYDQVKRIDLVDLDPRVTELFRTRPMLTKLNADALNHPALTIHNVDAWQFIEDTNRLYDVIIMDLPDPSRPSLGKLYSRVFFSLVARRLAAGGLLACQSTSPFRSREAFWCITHTIDAAQCGPNPQDTLAVRPYHTVVPTFGTWGFVLAGRDVPAVEGTRILVPTRYLATALLPSLFVFPDDMGEVATPISSLDDPVVSRLYEKGYHKYLE